MVSHREALGAQRACSTSPLDLADLCQVPMEALGALVGQWVHVSWVPHPLPEGVIPSGMAQVTPCGVARCVGDQVRGHTIEAVVAEAGVNHLLLLLHSEGPEEVALEEDLQMEEGALVGAWSEVVGIVPMKALVGA